ncbi:uncharacterized protein bif isoform X1 [Atheta coriaria]|uniref:uncharacterized protein bif isoform X1 n=1 Tax=Dalotia coriaria TaxID=877792 RepID=UPI0031F35F75
MTSLDNGITVEMPQWKRDLIMRRRAQAQAQAETSPSVNKQLDRVCCCRGGGVVGGSSGGGGGASVAVGCRPPLGHQPTIGSVIASGKSETRACSCCSPLTFGAVSSSSPTTCCADTVDMVHLHTDSDSSEELAYGPGIVSKLKNRYLSLTLRETVIKRRPSILRKATSLENLLDEDVYTNDSKSGSGHGDQDGEKQSARLYESRTNGTNGNVKNVPSSNRYRGATRGSMKRARSVEAISRIYSPKGDPPTAPTQTQTQPSNNRPKSMHEELNGTFAINPIITPRMNKPKRLTPVITEKEKPPADVVKQAKKIFETRPESRTRPPQHTGEVAAKVATYKTIIIQTKQANTITSKPPIKQKPVIPCAEEPLLTHNITLRKKPTKLNLKSSNNTMTSPLTSPNGNILSPTSNGVIQSPLSPPVITPKALQSPIPDVSMVIQEEEDKKTSSLSETPDLILHSSPVHVQKEKEKEKEKEKFDKEKDKDKEVQPVIHPEPELKKSKTEPLTLDITTYKSPVNNRDPVLVLSPREIEKNAINAACNGVTKPVVPNVINNSLPPLPAAPPVITRTKEVVVEAPPPPKAKTRKSKQNQQSAEASCIVFNFSDRKDVPDYIGNDGCVRTQHIPMPKAGEGGITLLPGSTRQDYFDEEELSLEGPPSPCDVSFINDNVLIDGKSSLSKKSKKSKLRIQFVEAIPQVFEYPSEASMLIDDTPALNQPLGGTTVPSLSGSTLANYTPKGAANEFQLGVTKAPPPPLPTDILAKEDEDVIEHDTPMLFSSGTNADILF